VALSGAMMQMVNHGVTTGALFALVGMLDERTHSREIATYGGIWGKTPVLSFFFLLFCMASAGVPGLNNFVGEFLVLVGTFKVSPAAAAGAFLGIVLTLIYTVRLVQEILFGKENKPLNLNDLSLREGGVLAVLAMVDIYLGVHPGPLLEVIKAPISLLTGVR
jgi:NADH-quinone oxidoreductase subunit M